MNLRALIPEQVQAIEATVCQHYQVDAQAIRSRDRHNHIAMVRQIIFYLVRVITNSSYEQIGAHFARDFSTTRYAYEAILERMSVEKTFGDHVNHLEAKCREALTNENPQN